MQLFDPNNPNERKKIVAAAALFVIAIAVLGYVLFGGSGKKPQTNQNATAGPRIAASPTGKPTPVPTPDDSAFLEPIPPSWPVPGVGDSGRNIFAFYEPPPPTPKPVIIPTPTPTPVPPMTITSMNPSTVFAQTADFSLEITGEKFTPSVRISVDGRELPTRFMNSQQLFTTVPAALISTPGQRTIIARASDGSKLYSNEARLNVTPPPLPNYNYVGIIGRPRGNDTVVLQEKGTKELLSKQRGDVLGGRFRIDSISEREVVLIDTMLKIRHKIPFTVDTTINNQPFRPPVRVTSDEP